MATNDLKDPTQAARFNEGKLHVWSADPIELLGYAHPLAAHLSAAWYALLDDRQALAMRHLHGVVAVLDADYTTPMMKAKVFEFGAKEYAPLNYLKGLSAQDIWSSLIRHAFGLDAEFPDCIDEKSKLPHAAHAHWNASRLIQEIARGTLKNDMARVA